MNLRAAILFAIFAAIARPQDVPRAEYPQPQFQRAQWMSLNGRWEFDFDDANAGLSENWAAGSKKLTRSIVVPFAFESKLSGIGDTSFHPWVWYRRSVTLPPAWKGRRVLLHFGAVDYRAMVWVNGKLAGEHEGGSPSFRFDITDLLSGGANTITVRAEDPPEDRSIPRGKQYWQPKSRGIFYTRTSGIWQPVWLEATGESYLGKVRISPSIRGNVGFRAQVARPQKGLELRAVIRFQKNEAARGSAGVDGEWGEFALQITDPQLWGVRQPNLYDVTFELVNGAAVLDRVESYFGFRQVTSENGRVVLNGRPVFLKTVLDQGYWPESLLTPPSEEAIQFDIKTTMDMGFNGARKHQKVEDPRWLYWCDRMGFLVSGEMANAYLFHEDYVSRFTREWMEVMERDWNHPSIIIWAPINESWGVPDLRDPRQQAHLKSIYQLTKSVDPTRLVIDNEGWEHTEMTDLFAIHDYARDGKLLLQKYKDLGKEGAPIPSASRMFVLPGYRYNGSPIFLSEFGGIAYIPRDAHVPSDSWGYSGVEKTPEAAIERMRSLWDAIGRVPAFAGLCYTQLTDVEQEVNGLLTYDRKLKFDAKTIAAINALIP